MPIAVAVFPVLIFGNEVLARDIDSSETVTVRTIPGEWKAYADDHFHFLIRANGPYDSGQPEHDIDRVSMIRGHENHQCAGTVRMDGSKLAFIDAVNAACTDVIGALEAGESSFPWSYVGDLGGEGDTEIWVDDTEGASAIWVYG